MQSKHEELAAEAAARAAVQRSRRAMGAACLAVAIAKKHADAAPNDSEARARHLAAVDARNVAHRTDDAAYAAYCAARDARETHDTGVSKPPCAGRWGE